MSNINSSAGTALYICATPNPTATDASQYAALTWVQVKPIETISEYGDGAASITFNAMDSDRVYKLKGIYDAGQMTVAMALDAADAGQTDCLAASATKYSYAIKIVLSDAANVSATDSIDYFQAKVMSFKKNPQGANNVLMRSLVLDITTEIVSVPTA